MHLNSIEKINGKILGLKTLSDDNLDLLPQVRAGSLIQGFDLVRRLNASEYKLYSKRVTYGLDFIRLLAEKYFVKYL